MSPDSFASPSSPRKRQLGFVPIRESPPPPALKVEDMDHDGMDDLWAELGGGHELGAPTEHMDYDDLLGSDENLLPDLSMPSLTTSNQSESVSDVPAVSSVTSPKMTPESSNPFIISPATSNYEPSPLNKESVLNIPATSAHSTDSIAQMLEYMRACNSQDAPPTSSYSLSNHSESYQQDDQAVEVQRSGRKKERSTSRTTTRRKQLSPTQKLSRSFSHGSDNLQRPNISALQQRARQRSKTAIGPPIAIAAAEGEDNNALHIDTNRAVQVTGPSGVNSQAGPSAYNRHRHPVSAGNEPWSAIESSSSSVAPSWPGQATLTSSQPSQKDVRENLSLSEFLKRPEGAMWFQHFQKQYPPRTEPTFAASTPFTVSQQMPVQSPLPSLGSLTPSISAYLPPPTDVASMLGMQQAPNQALVQAFQTAFVLGMQQLGMASQFQAAPPALSQPYPFSWTQQHPVQTPVESPMPLHHHHHQQQQQPQQTSITSPPPPQFTDHGESRDASSVLQSLLHDINQHRPDKQEFSLDEFLAFVANTVESTGDDVGHQQEAPAEKKAQEGTLVRKSRKKAEVGLEVPPMEKKKSSSSRRRTISISGQLSGTYLDDVAEDIVEVKKAEQHGYHHKSDKVTSSSSGSSQQLDSHYQQQGVGSGGGGGAVVVVEEKEEEEEDRGSDETQHHHRMSSSVSHGGGSNNNNNKSVKEREASKLAERRRRRRESHNAVERRRRDHINERIAELASLLPESMLLDAIAASTSGGTMPHIDLSLFARRPADTTTDLDLTDSHRDLEIKANALAPVHSSSETLALAQSKPNKGIILSKIVEYIKHLHEFCSVLRTKNNELQEDLDRNKALVSMDSSLSYRSGGTDDMTMSTATPPSHRTS